MGKQWKQSDFISLGSKITAAMKLLLGRKVMTNLDSLLKSRDITLPTKVHLVKAMVFPLVIYTCEIWTIKKAECQRIDAFELWCWRRLLRSPLGFKEIQPVNSINLKWIKDLNVRPETIKLLEENIGKTLSDINHSKILYDPPPRILE